MMRLLVLLSTAVPVAVLSRTVCSGKPVDEGVWLVLGDCVGVADNVGVTLAVTLCVAVTDGVAAWEGVTLAVVVRLAD